VYKTDLHIGAMGQFEHEPTKRPVLTGANATVQCSEPVKKDRCYLTAIFFENWLLEKYLCFALMNAP
jgi:hypothetical protein